MSGIEVSVVSRASLPSQGVRGDRCSRAVLGSSRWTWLAVWVPLEVCLNRLDLSLVGGGALLVGGGEGACGRFGAADLTADLRAGQSALVQVPGVGFVVGGWVVGVDGHWSPPRRWSRRWVACIIGDHVPKELVFGKLFGGLGEGFGGGAEAAPVSLGDDGAGVVGQGDVVGSAGGDVRRPWWGRAGAPERTRPAMTV